MGFEALPMDFGFRPDEGLGGVVVGGDEGADVGFEFCDGIERCAASDFPVRMENQISI